MKPQQIFEQGLLYHHYANTAYPLTPSSFRDYRIADPSRVPSFLSSEWAKADDLSLYVHIPFCQVRCKFCEYAVIENADETVEDEYVELLLREMDMYAKLLKGKRIVGYDIGGGTPTKLSVSQLRRITEALTSSFDIAPGTVFSIETTPVIAARDPDKIAAVKSLGYDRISMGIQTVSEELLNQLGREGTTHIYEQAAKNIRAAGFRKYNVDLMYGFLHQDEEDFERTLRYAIGLDPEFITLYRNRYKGTKLEGEAGGVSLYKIIRQYRLAYRVLNEAGWRANPGKNTFSRVPGDCGTSDYLTKRVIDGTPYVGMGLGAQSFGMDYLAYNEGAASKRMETYREAILAGRFPVQDIYELPVEETVAKMVSVAFYFGYVDLDAYARRFGHAFEDRFADEVAFVTREGLMARDGSRLCLTERGSDYINGVIPLFYSDRSKAELGKLIARRPEAETGEREFLKVYRIEDFVRPSVAADIVLLDRNSRRIALVKRGEHPFMDCWALPGGFARPDESLEETAARELMEETGVSGSRFTQLTLSSTPGRDPRGWVMSCSFVARPGNSGGQSESSLRFGDDAIDAQWFDVSYGRDGEDRRLLKLVHGETMLSASLERPKDGSCGFKVLSNDGMAFDHAAIIALALEREGAPA